MRMVSNDKYISPILSIHDECRAWKQIDWLVTNRLFEKGLIFNPIGKTKSIVLTDESLKQSE